MEQSELDLETAASRLGLRQETLRMLLERGIVPGSRDSHGRWGVQLNLDGQLTGRNAFKPPSAIPAGKPIAAPAPELQQILLDEIRFLRGQLEQRDKALAERDILLRDLVSALQNLSTQNAPPAPELAEAGLDNLLEDLGEVVREWLRTTLAPPRN